MPYWPKTARGAAVAARKAGVRLEGRRESAAKRGYGRQWRRLRAAFLAAAPLCVVCERHGEAAIATEVDHIVPKREGGADRLENLQGLCKSCHSKKTARGGLNRK